MIVKRPGGFVVLSHKTRKKLGGPYASRAQAEKRLAQIRYFKHAKG